MDPLLDGERGDKLLQAVRLLEIRSIQAELLDQVIGDDNLLQSRILSSLSPKIGKVFRYEDLNIKSKTILSKSRAELINLGLEENRRDVVNLNNLIKTLALQQDILTNNPEAEPILTKMISSETICTRNTVS